MKTSIFSILLVIFLFPAAWMLQDSQVLPRIFPNRRSPAASAASVELPIFSSETISAATGSYPIIVNKFSVQAAGVIPLNLAEDSKGHIWFTAADSDVKDFVLGEYNPSTQQLTVRQSLVNIRCIHYLAIDASDRVWYITSYGGAQDILGVFDPLTNEFTEWESDQFLGLYGLDVNLTSGEVWFTGTEPSPMVFRFAPDTATLTAWPITGYTWVLNLELDANGDIWMVDASWMSDIPANGTILRFHPQNNTLTRWTFPGLNQAPLTLDANTSGEVWFGEYPSSVNSLARLVLNSNVYEQYDIPAASSYPGGLILDGAEMWFNAPGIYNLGKLALPSTPDAQINLSPVNTSLTPSSPDVTVTVYDQTKFTTSFPQIQVPSPQMVNGNHTGNFSLYPIPSPGNCNPSAGPYTHGIIPSSGHTYWFAGCSYLGLVQDPQYIYLPFIIR